MLKKLVVIMVIVIIMATSFVVLFDPSRSSYLFLVGNVGVLDCDFLYGCRHEIGHRMDQALGFPSESPEFGFALQTYMLTELMAETPSEFAKYLITYPGVYSYARVQKASTQIELYAGIYTWADGDISLIPESLQLFYSKDQRYLDLYSCLTQPKRFNVCDGANFSYMKEN